MTPRQFRHIRLKHPIAIAFWRDLLDGIACRNKREEPWAAGVRAVVRRSGRLALGKAIRQPFLPLRNRIRAIFRGSTLSKRQIARQQAASSRS